jgi:outer membrane protein assembly factor BamB
MTSNLSQFFTLGESELRFDPARSTLLCKNIEKGSNTWIKKLPGIHAIITAIEDERRYYLSCESHDISGMFFALDKENGSTHWSIPGRAFMNVLHCGHLYLIFSDESNMFYFIKVDRETGSKAWHHKVTGDLMHYTIGSEKITLVYASGRQESISPANGLPC